MPKSKNRRKPRRPSGGGDGLTPTGDGTGMATTAENVRGSSAPKDKTPKKRVSPMQFFRQVRDEAQKVTWTSRNETLISTIMVLIMVVIASIFFFAVDEVLRRLIPYILNFSA